MRKLITLFFALCLAMTGQAQVTNTVNISTAGTLSTTLTTVELSTVTNLTITGTIDARDFKTMRDNMPALAVLDIGHVTIAAYTGSEGPRTDITIYPANAIPDYAFTIPVSYAGKKSLTFITLPASITAIGNTTFENCSNLTGTLTIPSTVTSIGVYAFYACSRLTIASIPNSVTSIGNCAFQACNAMTGNLLIPTSVTTIGILAFCGTNFSSVTIPATVTSIGSRAFIGCNALTEIIVDAVNPNYSSLNGVLFNKDQTTLVQCPAGKQGGYVIPGTVKSIGEYGIINCTKLTSLTLPSTLSTIATYAFYGCNGLTAINIPATVLWLDAYSLANCTNLTSIYVNSNPPIVTVTTFANINKTTCSLYVPYNTKSFYSAADQWKDFVNIIEINTAASKVNDEGITVYPNPVTDGFYIKGIEGKAKFTLIDVRGKEILASEVTDNKLIPANNLPKGVYIMKVTSDKGATERKMIKE